MINPWFDTARLCDWLSLRLAGGAPVQASAVQRILGGLSAETYSITAAWEAGGQRVSRDLILRRDPHFGARRLSGGVEREFNVLFALRDSPIPVPRVYGLELDPAWLERTFMVEEFVPGSTDRNQFNSPVYASLRPILGEQFIAILARLHTLDINGPGLEFMDHPGPGTSPAACEVARWEELCERTKLEPSPLLVEAFLWLKANLPAAPRVSLLHGEYRPGNFIYAGDQIRAILDWEYSHIGDPVEDLGWAFLRQFRVRHQECGFFTREEFLDRYEAKAGFAVDRPAATFWEVFSNVKVLAMLSDGQDAFRQKFTDYPLVSVGPGSNLQAEIVRLTGM